jgi:DNA-binding SARP family transcriptional activator
VTSAGCEAEFVDRIEIRLLGRPSVTINGEEARPPRGAKAWGLLAYLADPGRSRSRSELAELLFATAEDPLGALRWNLAALRRLLGLHDVLKGDPLCLNPAGATIDIRLLDAGDPAALHEPGIGQELLTGLSFSDSPMFEMWLVMARSRLARRSTSLLREAALAASARREHQLAVRYATELVAHEPLDEGCHALLIRVLAIAEDTEAARQQFEVCRQITRSELGTEPGPAVVAALHLADAVKSQHIAMPGAREAQARLGVAWQSFLAGSVDHALDLGRGAIFMADAGDNQELQAGARTFLGAMLGMAVRGWDEAATALTEARYIAQKINRPAAAATALGVRAGVEMMRADYVTARRCAEAGLSLSDDPGARSVNLTFLAAIEADVGALDDAVWRASAAGAAAAESGDPVQIFYAAAHAARIHLMAGDASAARTEVGRARAAGGRTMLALSPWSMSIQAEVELAERNLDQAKRAAKEAATLAATTKVAYQQALACRAMGLAESACGDFPSALAHLTEALSHARRTTGEGYMFHWPVAFVLDSLAEVTAVHDPHASQRWASALLDHAGAIGMHRFVARARHHLAGSES